MRMLLIGGGKVGSFLARELDKAGHVVSVIEEDHERALDLSEDTKVLVFQGDGTDVELLNAADVDRTDWLLAVTGRDEANLVACQLSLTLGAKRVLARLNDPRNRPTFDALDIPVVAVTDLMAQLISREVEVSDLHRIALMAGGQVSLIERILRRGRAGHPRRGARSAPAVRPGCGRPRRRRVRADRIDGAAGGRSNPRGHVPRQRTGTL